MTTDTLEALREAREALAMIAAGRPEKTNGAIWPNTYKGGFSAATEAHADIADPILSRIDAALAEGEGRNRPRPKLWPSNPKGPPPRTAFPAAATPDHIGNSTTMIPTLGVE
jgi:hypothetical protein